MLHGPDNLTKPPVRLVDAPRLPARLVSVVVVLLGVRRTVAWVAPAHQPRGLQHHGPAVLLPVPALAPVQGRLPRGRGGHAALGGRRRCGRRRVAAAATVVGRRRRWCQVGLLMSVLLVMRVVVVVAVGVVVGRGMSQEVALEGGQRVTVDGRHCVVVAAMASRGGGSVAAAAAAAVATMCLRWRYLCGHCLCWWCAHIQDVNSYWKGCSDVVSVVSVLIKDDLVFVIVSGRRNGRGREQTLIGNELNKRLAEYISTTIFLSLLPVQVTTNSRWPTENQRRLGRRKLDTLEPPLARIKQTLFRPVGCRWWR